MAEQRVPGTRPDRREFRDYPVVPNLADWSVAEIKSALTELERGSLTRAALLFEHMLRDDRVGGVLDARLSALHGLPLSFEPERGGHMAGPLVRELEESWWRWFPEPAVKELQMWAIGLGVGLGEILWSQGDRWTPRLKVWHPMFLSWRDDLRQWQVQTADGLVPVVPGDGKWLLLSYGDRRPWMAGLVRRLAIPWLIRQFAWRDWARYSEVHGLPIRKGKVPASAREEDKQQFLRELAALGSESTIRLPQGDGDLPGFDVELIEAAARSWEGFHALIDTTSTAIAVAVLGQNLTTEVKRGGSYAAALVHSRVRQDFLEADAELLSTALHDQVLTHWAAFNYGRPAPWPRWDTTPPEDKKAMADRLNVLMMAINQARQAGIPIDERAVLERAGVPVLPEGQAVARRLPGPPGHRVLLASGGDPRKARGFIEGQVYADRVADHAIGGGIETSAPDVRALLDVVDQAEDYDDLRKRLVVAYRDMSPDRLADLVEKSIILADLAGRFAVLQDL